VSAVQRWKVRGRVQGVGFRWYVQRRAEVLGLDGFARNLPDGSVEVVARGPTAALDQLHRALLAGPRLSRVEDVEMLDVPQDISLPNFFDTN